MFSVHGLVRGENMELGRDADTGGQIQYVVELVRALSESPKVAHVDLFTRQVIDQKVDDSYAIPEEILTSKARIVRVLCGPRRYLRKEVIWPYLDQFADLVLKHFRGIGRVPDFLHAHYADAGYVGTKLSHLLGIPLLFTGHSLGRVKRQRLLENGMPKERIPERYNIHERIEAEENALSTATMVIASTNQEVEEQYKIYEHYQPKRMVVIPPGINMDRFSSPRKSVFGHSVTRELSRFLNDLSKPMILAISRADERKNITTLIQAYAE
ncbi:MAG: glycosyltransferase, partial [bacterium]